MQDSTEYRVLGRRKFALIMAPLLGAVSVGVWVGLDHMAEYVRELEAMAEVQPLEAATSAAQLLRKIAIVNGIVLSSLALLSIRHGTIGWRTASMPPRGSWILEGKRTWTGEPAVRIAKFTITVGILLGILSAISSVFLWNLGDAFVDQIQSAAAE